MKKSPLETLTEKSLVELFIDYSLEQDDAELGNETARWNRLYRKLEAVAHELKARPGDQRRLLVPLYRHKNSQVRVNAAKATVAVAPRLAREALEWIAQWDVGSQRVEALDMMSALDSGRYVPD